MEKPMRVQASWRWPALLGLHLLAALVLASWLWPTTRELWDLADDAAYRALNGSLEGRPVWMALWAFASTRLFDVLAGGLMLALLIRQDWTFRRHELRPALFTFIALLAMLLVVRSLFTKIGVHFGWQHASPSVVLGGIHLSDQFPLLESVFEVKDRSSRSFPGDHASVLMLWGLFMAIFARGWKRVTVLAIATVLMLPRLVAGAHWLTDDVVGGLVITLVVIAWGFCTPAGSHLAHLLQWLASPALRMGGYIPLVNRLALLDTKRLR